MSACDNEDTPQAIAANQPRELLKLISTNVRQLAFEEYRKGWDKAWLCYHVVCRPVDHLSERDYDAITATFLTECGETIAEACEEPEIVEEENFDDWLWERESETFSHSDKHRDNIDTLERKIGENPDLRDDPKFADARKMFSEEFGLDIHFQVYHEETSDHDPWLLRMNDVGDRSLMTYLILPSSTVS